MPGVDLQRLLLVEIVVPLHVLGLAVRLRLDDPLHVGGPAKPFQIIRYYYRYKVKNMLNKRDYFSASNVKPKEYYLLSNLSGQTSI